MLGKALRTDRPARNMVSARVREMICARGLRPGDRLPTYQQLILDLGVSLVTVKRGLDDLEREGIVLRRPPSGARPSRWTLHAYTAWGLNLWRDRRCETQ